MGVIIEGEGHSERALVLSLVERLGAAVGAMEGRFKRSVAFRTLITTPHATHRAPLHVSRQDAHGTDDRPHQVLERQADVGMHTRQTRL